MNAERELTCNFVSVLGAVLASTKLASKSSSSFALDKSWHIFTAFDAAFDAGPEGDKVIPYVDA